MPVLIIMDFSHELRVCLCVALKIVFGIQASECIVQIWHLTQWLDITTGIMLI